MATDHILAECSARSWSVPAFRETRLRARGTRYVIVIPVINEGDRIGRQLREMRAQGITGAIDTVVVDGGSTDGSLGDDLLRETGVVALLVKTGAGRLSAQLRCAYAWALIEGYEGIITIDGNGKDGVATIPLFAAALDHGFGYVQASRFLRGGHHANTPLIRHLAIRLIHAPLQSLAAHHWLTDTAQGYRAYSSAFLLDPRTQPFRDVFSRYELLAYLTGRASRLGYRVTEIPTSRVYPANEAIPTKIVGLGALLDLIGVLIAVLLGRFNPPDTKSHPNLHHTP